jgi:hypothetical protein
MSLVLILLGLCLPGGGELDWINAPRMHNPTVDAVLVACIPEQDAEIQAFWAGRQSPLQLVRAGELCLLELDGLQPGRRTPARISARAPGADAWELHESLELRTLPPRREAVRFAVMADTHAWALHSKTSVLGGPIVGFKEFKSCLKNIAGDDDLDFGVVFTDFAMTQCGSCLGIPTSVGPTTAGSVETLNEALVRYRMTWGQKMLGSLGAALPLVTMNGDHEGELPFLADETGTVSRMARVRTLPPYQQGYLAGPPGTLAYAFEAGPVLLVSLDLHSLSVRAPIAPEHWRLGQAQHEWLAEVLGSSRRPWKIVMAEHLVGGLTDPTFEHWKGRGSITATDDGTPEGTFLGEQALVHQTLVSTGADLFITGHDHVVSWAEKDGVAYLIAGRAGGVGHPWADLDWYREAMDLDGDGVPVYETEGRGTRESGHVEISADLTSLRVRYLQASLQESLNGNVLLDLELAK